MAAQLEVVRILTARLRGCATLEVGVGTGRWARPLQTNGINVVGVDVSREMIAQGVRLGLNRVMLAEAGRLPFRHHTFDVAMTNHVLHLLPDWAEAIREIRRVTRGQYLTVVERPAELPDLDAEYHDAVSSAGVNTSRPGIHERDIGRRTNPDEVIPVGQFIEEVSSRAVLERLRTRSQSSQWSVPDPVHAEVMDQLERNHRDEAVRSTLDVEIDIWSVERLPAIVAQESAIRGS